jgi:ABC-type lipoprotein release transport system permease subunit
MGLGFSVFPAFLGCGIMTMHGFFVIYAFVHGVQKEFRDNTTSANHDTTATPQPYYSHGTVTQPLRLIFQIGT